MTSGNLITRLDPKSPSPMNFNRSTRLLSHLRIATAATLIAAAVVSAIASFKPHTLVSVGNTRLTNDNGANGGYVSDYTLVTGQPYTDDIWTACSQSRGRQNEPAVA